MNATAHAHASCCSDQTCSDQSCRCEHCGCSSSSWIKAFTPGLAVGVVLGAFIGVAVSEFGGTRLAPNRPEPGVASTVTRDQPPPADDEPHEPEATPSNPAGGH